MGTVDLFRRHRRYPEWSSLWATGVVRRGPVRGVGRPRSRRSPAPGRDAHGWRRFALLRIPRHRGPLRSRRGCYQVSDRLVSDPQSGRC